MLEKNIDDILSWMSKHGQSIILNWGEDNNLWECAWIDGKGNRHVAFEATAREAAIQCIWGMYKGTSLL